MTILKRFMDVSLALVLAVLAAPVFVVVALLNPFFNPGPLFFTQLRVGCDETLFRMWKLRTMLGESSDTRFATSEDHRITRFGRFLRRSRLDELPQVFNVLLGQMSIVGPRPEQPGFYAQYSEQIPRYRERQQLKPGITGLAQVMMGYTDSAAGAQAKLQWDLYYISNHTLKMELYVLSKTVVVLILGNSGR